MIAIDENSKTFQREVIIFLISKLIETNLNQQLNRDQILSDINNFLNKNNIYDIEGLLSKSSDISKILRVPAGALNSYISKNVFKAIQYLKKEKETINLYLSDEKNSILKVLKHFFLYDLSNSNFICDNDKYVLVQPNKKILENTRDIIETTKNQESPVDSKKSSDVKQKTLPKTEEISIIQEIIQKFSNLKFDKDLSTKIEELDDSSISKVDTVEKEEEDIQGLDVSTEQIISDKKPQAIKSSKIESISIITELLQTFSELFPIKNDLQMLVNKEEDSKPLIHFEIDQEEPENDLNLNQEDITIIPFTISDYMDVRKEIQKFKTNQDMSGYQQFISSSNQAVKSCIALMNIQKKENEPAFNLKSELQKVSIKLNVSVGSLLEFYQRIKRYNVCIGAIKQASDYLQKASPHLYKSFLEIKEPFLDFLSELNPANDEDFHTQNLQKKLKILLLPVHDVNLRNKLSVFLEHLIQKMIKLL